MIGCMATISTAECSAITGATMRQLQWWDERGIVKPWRSDSGVRAYTLDQALWVLVLLWLKYSGVSLAKSRRLVADAIPRKCTAMVVFHRSMRAEYCTNATALTAAATRPEPVTVVPVKGLRLSLTDAAMREPRQQHHPETVHALEPKQRGRPMA